MGYDKYEQKIGRIKIDNLNGHEGFEVIFIPMNKHQGAVYLAHNDHEEIVHIGRYSDEITEEYLYQTNSKQGLKVMLTSSETFIMTPRIAPVIYDVAEEYVEANFKQEELLSIKELRRRLKMTQQEFSYEFGLSVRNLQNWEQGITKTPEYLIPMIKRLLDAEGAKHEHWLETQRKLYKAGKISSDESE